MHNLDIFQRARNVTENQTKLFRPLVILNTLFTKKGDHMCSYSNISPSGGDTGASLNLAKRLSLINSHITIKSSRILDAGCGTGLYVSALFDSGSDSYGVEFYNDKVDSFRRNFPKIAHRVTNANIEKLNFEDGFFDAVLLNEVLEHVPNIDSSLVEIRRVLRPGGKLIIFSPNRLYPFETHPVSLRSSGMLIPHGLPFIPYIPISIGNIFLTYDARNFWPHELRHIINTHGFNLVHSQFITQTFENISGHQPNYLKNIRPVLRYIFSLLENIPIVRSFAGVSQMCVAIKS